MGTLQVQLPNAIRQTDGSWTKEVELDEMTGEEEDILADQTREQNGKGTLRKSGPRRITEILSRCTVRVGGERRPDGKDRWALPDYFKPIWAPAYSNDRVYSMIRLRQLTLGNKYTFSASCPACKKEIPRCTVDLSTLEVSDIPIELAKKETHDVTLPGSGKRVSWRFLTGEADEEMIEDTMKTMKSQFISAILYARIAQVDGGSPSQAGGLDFVRRMSAGDRRYLTNHFDMSEGGIDTDVQLVCDNCNTEFSTKMEVLNGRFFFPTAIPSPSNSTSAPLPSHGGGTQQLPSGSPSPDVGG